MNITATHLTAEQKLQAIETYLQWSDMDAALQAIKSRSDCVYRALSIATGKDWLTIYDELTALGRELLAPPNDDFTYKHYLDQIGTRVKVPGVLKGKRPTGKDVARMDSSKTYVVRMAGHLVCVKGGKIRDTWNCGHKAAYITWELR